MRLCAIAFLFFSTIASAQNLVEFKVLDKGSGEPLIGVTISFGNGIGNVTNVEGFALVENIPDGEYHVIISYVGYQDSEIKLKFPGISTIQVIELMEGEELEEVIVLSTRSSRLIDDIPTRIEVISSEELVEKSAMKSANIAMLLRESTGILMQQTSASSANQSIRIQGLDGRYTQMLKDGFPLYSAFSSGLSIMQIPPLDLRQVEVIKGSNSTLYGGGAIAGLVNLVTYQPEDERKLKLMIDQTSAGGSTFNGFYSQRFNKVGVSLYVSANRQEAYDPNNDDFSDIPQIRSLTINPSFYYFFDESTSLRLTLNTTFENRLGGDMEMIENDQPGIYQFTEENESERYSYQLSFLKKYGDNRSLNIKNTLSYFDRLIKEPTYIFSAKQYSSFSEISYSIDSDRTDWVTGVNVYTDKFIESPFDSLDRSYDYTTIGGFAQNNYFINKTFTLETGFRADYNLDFGLFALPRLSLLSRLNEAWSLRLGGGLGYKLPTIFTEEAENLTYENILPLSTDATNAERSIGGNLDINVKTAFGNDWTFSINQLFFITQLQDALVFRDNTMGQYYYENADGPVTSRGLETNMKLTFKDFKLFANYAYISTVLEYDNLNEQKPLTPKHNIGTVLMYEVEDKWRIGYEAYYKGSQFRNDRTQTSDYWIMGFMMMRKLGRISLYINFENFTDTRQHNLENFDINEHFKPDFPELWAPTDGSVINGGLIIEL
jgi:iron complex outermembrane receptor protein